MGIFLKCADGELEGRAIPLEEGRAITLGRDPGNDIRVNDRKLSRVHCQIILQGNRCVVTDLDSTNGTFVNGARIEQQEVRPGDIIQIGLTRLLVETADPAIHSPPPSSTSAPPPTQTLLPAEPAAPAAPVACASCGAPIAAEEITGARRVGKRHYCHRCRAGFAPRAAASSAVPDARPPAPDIKWQTPKSGDNFAGMRVIEAAGQGLCGPLFRAEHQSMSRPALLQLIQAGDREWGTKAAQAAAQTGRLIHPNILLVSDAGVWNEQPYIVWEQSGTQPLGQLINDGKPDYPAAGHAMLQIAQALAFAAEAQITHGMLCPANVLLTPAGRAKVAGFGIAALPPPPAWKHRFPDAALPYRAPEQFNGAPAPPFSADAYGLGALYLFTLTGRPPFSGDPDNVVAQIKATDNWPPNNKRLPPDSPPAIAEIIERCLSPIPGMRPATAKDLLATLEQSLA